jgi:glycosyltransferase involved in cell wall biosynthesis
VKVLYLNHTGAVSGAERSLLTLLDALPADIEGVVASPDGELAAAVAQRGIAHRPIPGTDVSFRLHPLHTTRGLVDLARAARSVAALVRGERPDVVHANSSRAGLVAALARPAAPLVVSIRDTLGEGRVGAVTRRALARRATTLLPNSDFVRADLADVADRVGIVTVHNAVDLTRFDPDAHPRGEARAAIGVAGDVPLLGIVGQITPWKGQIDAINALALVREHHSQAELVIAGSAKFVTRSTRYDNVTYERELRATAERLGVAAAVHFLGEREDVPAVMAALDVLLVPSWAEPFGRVAIEAMAMGVPVVATSQGGTAEIISDDVDGLLVEPRRPELWAAAATRLISDESLRARLAVAAHERVHVAFTPARHVEMLAAVYAGARGQDGP